MIKTESGCFCSVSVIRSASFYKADLAFACRWNVNTHENERTKLPQWIEWLAEFLDQNSTSSLTQLHLYTISHWCKSMSRRRVISPLILCRGRIWSAIRYGIVQPGFRETQSSRVWKSLFVRESRRSLSVLLRREWRFPRWMLGSGVLNPRWRSFTSAPAHFPLLCVLKRLNSTTAPPTTMSSKIKFKFKFKLSFIVKKAVEQSGGAGSDAPVPSSWW